MARDNSNKHIYNSTRWKKLRALKLLDEPLCRICKSAEIIRPTEHIDHITPIAKGGEPFDWDNLQGLCLEHHSLKTAEDEGKQAKWGCSKDGNPLSPHSHWNQ